MNIKLLITNWVLITCPGDLRNDKEVSPTVSGLCSALENHFLSDVLKLTLSFRLQTLSPTSLGFIFVHCETFL